MTGEILQNEKDIVLGIIQGNQESFRSLYDAYAERVYYFAFKFLKSSEKAEDITQEVFIKLWETRERLDPENSLNAYIFTITRNSLFNVHRKKLNELAYLDSLKHVFQSSDSGTEQDFQLNELQQEIDRCLADLPPQRKKVFTLSRYEGLSHREISLKMGIAEKTVAAHMRLALQAFRKALK